MQCGIVAKTNRILTSVDIRIWCQRQYAAASQYRLICYFKFLATFIASKILGRMLSKKLQERREYLRQKDKEQSKEKKQEALQNALKNSTKIPHHLRGEAKELLDEIIYGTREEEVVYSPPKIAVTTSHAPSSFLKSFSKHISLIFNGFHLMRGRMSESELSEYCATQKVTHLIVLRETKGNPSSLLLCKYPNGPTYQFSIFNVKYQRRQKPIGEKAYLVLDGMSSEVGKKLQLDLSLCFPKVSKASRVVAFINRRGTIAFRHFLVENRKLSKECEFDMKLFRVMNSTFEMNGDVDFALKPFMNSTNDDILTERDP